MIKADVVGPICESGDFLARDRRLRACRAGDLFAVLGAGAYGFVMSSNYNTQPLIPEVMVDGGHLQLARRRQTLDDILREETSLRPLAGEADS